MPTTGYTQERGGEIRSHVPVACAAVGAALAAFFAGGFVLIVTVLFGAVVAGCLGLAGLAVARAWRGEDLGPSEMPEGDQELTQAST